MSSAFILSLLALAPLVAQNSGFPVQLIVTAEGHKGHEPPDITAADVMAYLNKDRAPVEDLAPCRGDRAGLQLALLIDDGADTDLSLQFGDLKKFIRSQPATTQVGVYYMRNGSAIPVQNMTADHEAAAQSLRLPIAQPGIAASPFLALSDFVKKWPATEDRREVLMISSGIDLYRGTASQNPYLSSAIDDAQRARVLVHSIYFGGAGHWGHDYFLINFGRDNLSRLGDETGGEAYWQGLSTSVSFEPYLEDLSVRLKHQYVLTIAAKPARKAQFQTVQLKTEMKHVELMTAEKIWLPAAN